MNRMKRIAVLLAAVLVTGLFAGCGRSFDASAYIKALMDNSYKNDSTGIVEQKIGTAEQAKELYEEGLDAEMQQLVANAVMSEELQTEYRNVFADMFKKANYTVGKAEKKDTTYTVTVTYQKLKVFEPAFTSFQEKQATLLEEWTSMGADAPSEDEMFETIYTALKDCMKEALEAPEYAKEATATVRVELSDNVYTPNQEDLYGLESLLFDIDAIENLQ